jgi:hypothetical protein
MIEHKSFNFGTPVKVEYTVENEKSNKVYAKVICSNFKDKQIYSCITPHGSIIKTHYSNLDTLNDDEYFYLKDLEQKVIESNNILYNNLFFNDQNTGIK